MLAQVGTWDVSAFPHPLEVVTVMANFYFKGKVAKTLPESKMQLQKDCEQKSYSCCMNLVIIGLKQQNKM